MIRVKQEVKTPWLADSLVDNNKGNVFPSLIVLEIKDFDDEAAGGLDTDIWNAINNHQMIIPIIVDSFGGQVYSLLRMLDTIAAAKAQGATILTIGRGKMMSCGSVLVSAGSKGFRYVQPSATLMIHEVASAGRGKNMEIQADAAETDRLNRILLYKLAELAGKPKKFFEELIHNMGHADMFISAKDTVSLGLVDFVGEPTISMKLHLDVEISKK